MITMGIIPSHLLPHPPGHIVQVGIYNRDGEIPITMRERNMTMVAAGCFTNPF